jgi:hypothetical protein
MSTVGAAAFPLDPRSNTSAANNPVLAIWAVAPII